MKGANLRYRLIATTTALQSNKVTYRYPRLAEGFKPMATWKGISSLRTTLQPQQRRL